MPRKQVPVAAFSRPPETDAPVKPTIVVVGPGCWGSGTTLQAALQRALVNAPRQYRATGKQREGMPYNAYEATADFEVDQSGRISATKLKRIREVRFEDGKQEARTGDAITHD